jgi:ChrR-like protein with cupin domain
MIHRHLTDDLRDLALDYALGFLPPAQAAAVQEHLAEGCELCTGEVRANRFLTDLMVPTVEQPPPQLRDRLLALIQADSQEQPITEHGSDAGTDSIPTGWTIVRGREGEWIPGGAEGVAIKPLSHDAAEHRRTILVRLEAGGRYPGFRTADNVELYLVEGDLHINSEILCNGDYCAAPAGTAFDDMVSVGGGQFILLTPDHTEMWTKEQGRPSSSNLVIIRAAEGSWLPGPADGVTVKPLFTDPARGTATYLVRAHPGSHLPRHRHVTADQTLLLEGDGRMGTLVVEAGDFYRAEPGTVHDLSWTERGCLCITLASISDITN